MNQVNQPEPSRTDSSLTRLKEDVRVFRQRYEEKLNEWSATLETARNAADEIAVWGAGSKGVMFLNTLEIDPDGAFVIDINPRKAGKYVPGSGQLVVQPDALRTIQPDLVIVLNRIYEREIRERLAALDVRAELMFA